MFNRPSDGQLRILGKGWGHGIGASAYGVLGAANQGKTWSSITSFYYPGTTRATVGNVTLKVLVSGALGSWVKVRAASGLYASYGPDRTGSFALPATESSSGQPITYYGVAAGTQTPGTATRAVLTYTLADGTKKTWKTAPGGQINIENRSTGAVSAYNSASTKVEYRGELRGILVGSPGAETVTPVLAIPLESYLRSTVPSEVPPLWPREAVTSFAVMARSFAYYFYVHPRSSYYHICDTTSCQVFSGSAQTPYGGTRRVIEHPNSDAAIAATVGTILSYGGGPALTMYSAANGGRTADGGLPYLRAQQDPYDDNPSNPYFRWKVTVPASMLESAYGLGTLRSITITARDGGADWAGRADWGGRVVTAVLIGSSRTVTISGSALKSALGLRERYLTFTSATTAPSYPRDQTGDRRADLSAIVASTGRLLIYPGTGTGRLGSPVTAPGSDWRAYPRSLTAGAWDADALSDVLAVNRTGDLLLYRGASGGGLATPTRIGTGWSGFDLLTPVGDLDGDGWADLLARRPDGAVFLYSGNGSGGFLRSRLFATDWRLYRDVFSPGDFDGDGRGDLLCVNVSGELWLYSGSGTGGGFAPRRLLSASGWTAYPTVTSPGDVNGDGRGDIVVRNSVGALYYYPGNGAGGYSARVQMVASGWNAFSQVLR